MQWHTTVGEKGRKWPVKIVSFADLKEVQLTSWISEHYLCPTRRPFPIQNWNLPRPRKLEGACLSCVKSTWHNRIILGVHQTAYFGYCICGKRRTGLRRWMLCTGHIQANVAKTAQDKLLCITIMYTMLRYVANLEKDPSWQYYCPREF